MEANYGKELKKERLRYGLTQQKIADILGYSRVIISFIESGKREVRPSEFHTMYTELKIDVGFGRTFELIDTENDRILTILESSAEEFSNRELRIISEKNYDEMQISTLERIENAININVEGSEMLAITASEEERLKKILNEYLKKDGSIERALQLLEFAVQE